MSDKGHYVNSYRDERLARMAWLIGVELRSYILAAFTFDPGPIFRAITGSFFPFGAPLSSFWIWRVEGGEVF